MSLMFLMNSSTAQNAMSKLHQPGIQVHNIYLLNAQQIITTINKIRLEAVKWSVLSITHKTIKCWPELKKTWSFIWTESRKHDESEFLHVMSRVQLGQNINLN